MFLLVSGGHICAPERDTNILKHGVSIQSFINLGKTFFRISLSLSIRPSYGFSFRFHLSPFPQKRLILRLNFSYMNCRIELILGKAFCLFIFFNFPDSRLSVLKGFHFYFCILTWVKTENSCAINCFEISRDFLVRMIKTQLLKLNETYL